MSGKISVDNVTRNGFLQYQRRLSGVERRWVGEINRIYRELRKDLLDAVDRHGLNPIARQRIIDGFERLKMDVRNLSHERALELKDVAHEYVQTQLRDLRDVGAPTPSRLPDPIKDPTAYENTEWVDNARANVLGEFTRQRLSDEEDPKKMFAVKLIDDGGASPYRKGQNSMKRATVLATWGVGNSFLRDYYGAVADQVDYQRQAIASIDERTTDTCLHIHGEIVGMDEYFELTHRPRFARRMKEPPFHWYCRTSVTLYHPRMDESGITTAQMKRAARVTRKWKERGDLGEIHPAHATSTPAGTTSQEIDLPEVELVEEGE